MKNEGVKTAYFYFIGLVLSLGILIHPVDADTIKDERVSAVKQKHKFCRIESVVNVPISNDSVKICPYFTRINPFNRGIAKPVNGYRHGECFVRGHRSGYTKRNLRALNAIKEYAASQAETFCRSFSEVFYGDIKLVSIENTANVNVFIGDGRRFNPHPCSIFNSGIIGGKFYTSLGQHIRGIGFIKRLSGLNTLIITRKSDNRERPYTDKGDYKLRYLCGFSPITCDLFFFMGWLCSCLGAGFLFLVIFYKQIWRRLIFFSIAILFFFLSQWLLNPNLIFR